MKHQLFLISNLFFAPFLGLCQDGTKLDSSGKQFTEMIKTLSNQAPRLSNLELTKAIKDSIFSLKSDLKNTLSIPLSNPISLRGASFDYSLLQDQAYLSEISAPFGTFSGQTSWTLFSLPVELSYTNNHWDESFHMPYNNMLVKFNREEYLRQIKDRLTKIDSRKLMQGLPDPVSVLKSEAQKKLNNELLKLNEDYGGLLQQKIGSVGNLQNLFSTDIAALRQQFLDQEYLSEARKNQELLEALQHKKNSGEQVDHMLLESISKSLQQYNGTQEMIKTIEAHQKRWLSSGLIQKIKTWELAKKNNVESILNDPSMIGKLAKEQLSLNGLQRLFLKVNRLGIGQQALSSSKYSVYNFLNKGIITDFISNGKTLLLFMGKSQDNISASDLPFSNSIGLNTAAKVIRFGKQNQNGASSGVSFMSYDQSLVALPGQTMISALRRSLVTTLQKEFLINNHGLITTELSRSLSNYPNQAGKESGLQEMFSLGNLSSNTSFSIRYRDEYPKAGLNYELSMARTALGYNNPGSPFLNNGSNEIGINLRKKLWKDRFVLSLRNNIRQYRFNEKLDVKWRSIYSVVDIRFKLNRSQILSIRYMPSRMIRYEDQNRQVYSSFDRVSVNANLYKKIGKRQYNNFLALSYQSNQYVLNSEKIRNVSLGLVCNQILSIKNYSFFWNTQLDRANNSSGLVYFNSNLNSEIGSGYQVFKKLQASTSITYSSISGWFEQVGLRQSLSSNIGENFDISVYLDARKSLRLYHPLMYGLLRAEVAIHYTIKNFKN